MPVRTSWFILLLTDNFSFCFVEVFRGYILAKCYRNRANFVFWFSGTSVLVIKNKLTKEKILRYGQNFIQNFCSFAQCKIRDADIKKTSVFGSGDNKNDISGIKGNVICLKYLLCAVQFEYKRLLIFLFDSISVRNRLWILNGRTFKMYYAEIFIFWDHFSKLFTQKLT